MAKMSRVHFQLADVLKDTKPNADQLQPQRIQWDHMILAMARELRKTNPNFKRQTFLDACGFST